MIYLNYKDFKIGKLEFKNDLYVYNSLENENYALQEFVGMLDYDLINSKNKTSKSLFAFFQRNFIDEIKDRKDILKKIDNKSKNCYEILEKLCKLNLDKFGFWLSDK